VVHHLPHEVDVGHEDRGVPLLEEVVDAQEALLEGFSLCAAHHVAQLRHRLAGLRLLAGLLDGLDEKLQRRFLQDDGEVRGLRLG
jgi:hypothetical protein